MFAVKWQIFRKIWAIRALEGGAWYSALASYACIVGFLIPKMVEWRTLFVIGAVVFIILSGACFWMTRLPWPRFEEIPDHRRAVHEAGHAVLAWFGGIEVLSASIEIDVENNSGGRVVYATKHHTIHVYDRRAVNVMVVCKLAGPAAEEEVYASVTEGCSGDWSGTEVLIKAYSKWGGRVDSRALFRESWSLALELVKEHRAQILLLASEIEQRRTLSGDDIEKVLGPMPT